MGYKRLNVRLEFFIHEAMSGQDTVGFSIKKGCNTCSTGYAVN